MSRMSLCSGFTDPGGIAGTAPGVAAAVGLGLETFREPGEPSGFSDEMNLKHRGLSGLSG